MAIYFWHSFYFGTHFLFLAYIVLILLSGLFFLGYYNTI